MKLVSAILAVILVTAASQAEGRNCRQGMTYCGSTLRAIATGQNYDAQMAATGHTSGNDLFYCKGGDNGDIIWIQTCPTHCNDGGSEYNDWCA
ncbi:uncharacterized protein EV422DRAFT_334151 [Fimicolochytrium jonesii]|uniref:uncharacterized protein n=1 Tax=Fimicolochytrium jonesii TaxID=1396493 RepID=UPI0022FE072D|nr:uncharacterized protein EV422DRAFT_334151 [Fimicolochytrium jonesii]KAI8816118.1 hypothetical protein EV422DRAFT_334151 [Fimicolochytrium jonesii]